MVPVAVLVGMPGSGKTTVGRSLASALSVPFLDTDNKIEEITGRTIANIFREDGEEKFRQIEAMVVTQALFDHHGIVSLGGGAITIPGVRRALIGHTVIYLKVEAAEGIRRATTGTIRSLLAGPDPAAKYLALLSTRAEHYERVATSTVENSRSGPAAVVDNLCVRLRSSVDHEESDGHAASKRTT